MPIVSGEINYYRSTNDLGGAITGTEITSGDLNNLFDDVTSAESETGDTEYRCLYVKNDNATLTLQSSVAFIQDQAGNSTPSPDTTIELGLGTSAVGGVEQTVADESTEPSGISWQAGLGSGNSLSIGNIPNGEWKALWIKRIVSVGASAYSNDSGIIEVSGDTAA